MLHTWKAQRLEKILTNGRTKPLVIECEYVSSQAFGDNNEQAPKPSERRLFVVKSPGHPDVTDQGLFSELFGNLLGRQLGLKTPEPALITLSQAFVEATKPSVVSNNINLSPGQGVGCEYLARGLTSVVPWVDLPNTQMQQAVILYAFDLLVQNPDRRPDKVNCAIHSGDLIAFDFELCFSFLYLLLGKQFDSWEVSKHRIAPQHLFYPILRKNQHIDWKPFIERLQALTEHHFDQLAQVLVPNWQDFAERVRTHVFEVILHAPQFEMELQRSLL